MNTESTDGLQRRAQLRAGPLTDGDVKRIRKQIASGRYINLRQLYVEWDIPTQQLKAIARSGQLPV